MRETAIPALTAVLFERVPGGYSRFVVERPTRCARLVAFDVPGKSSTHVLLDFS